MISLDESRVESLARVVGLLALTGQQRRERKRPKLRTAPANEGNKYCSHDDGFHRVRVQIVQLSRIPAQYNGIGPVFKWMIGLLFVL